MNYDPNDFFNSMKDANKAQEDKDRLIAFLLKAWMAGETVDMAFGKKEENCPVCGQRHPNCKPTPQTHPVTDIAKKIVCGGLLLFFAPAILFVVLMIIAMFAGFISAIFG